MKQEFSPMEIPFNKGMKYTSIFPGGEYCMAEVWESEKHPGFWHYHAILKGLQEVDYSINPLLPVGVRNFMTHDFPDALFQESPFVRQEYHAL